MNDILEQLEWLPQPFCLTTESSAQHFLKLAYAHGNTTSPDPSTKNGAVLVGTDWKIITYSSNRFAKGIAETRTRLNDKLTKYRLVVHAENGAIFNAARHGKCTKGSILYCPFYSCPECSKAIIEAGVQKVVGHAQFMALASGHEKWVEPIQHGWDMMQEAGIECVLFDGVIGVIARLNGQDIAV